MLEANFMQPGRACSCVSGLWGSSRGLAVLGAAAQECSTSHGWERLAGLLVEKGALPQGCQDWQDCPALEADFMQLGGAFSSFSGLQDFSRGLAVLSSCSTGV